MKGMLKQIVIDAKMANVIYDILAKHAGAPESQREAFIHYYIKNSEAPYGYNKWSFDVFLGRKLRIEFFPTELRPAFRIYYNDETRKHKRIIAKVNRLLGEIRLKYKKD